MSVDINTRLVDATNDLTKLIKEKPDIVVKRLEEFMVAIATNMVNMVAKNPEKQSALYSITGDANTHQQRGGADGELVASAGFGVNEVKPENVSSVTKALEKALTEAIAQGEFEKMTRLQHALDREQIRSTAVIATTKASQAAEAAIRTSNAAAQALEQNTRLTTLKVIQENIVNGVRYAGLAGASYIITRLEYAAPRIVLTVGDLAASSSIGVIVEAYNAAFTNVFVSTITGAEPINATRVYDDLTTTITQSQLGTVIGEESDNLFLVVMLINFAIIISCAIMINKLSQLSGISVLGSGISFQRETTKEEQQDIVRILGAAQQAAQAIAPSPGAQALGSSGAAAQALAPPPETPAIEEIPSQYSVQEGGKNKRKRRKSRKQQKSKKSKKSHKSHKSKKQQKSRKQQRKSRKNLKFKKTRK